tara:strand:+ start:3956 stop:5155 length:1200 start_codon:yes stop_codon:yes gene_type:complete
MLPYKIFDPKSIEYKNLFKSVLLNEFSGESPPAVFVGSKFYPKLNVGILSPPEKVKNPWVYDAQKHWAEKDFSIKDVLSLRSKLINSRFKANIFDVRNSNKFLDISKEIAMSYKSVGVEIELKKKVKIALDLNQIESPLGPRGELKKVIVTENPKIHNKVEKVFSDTDLKANEAIDYLYKNNFNDDFLVKLLSIGTLGLKKNRKLVPTRWSITAVDDIIAKNLMKEVKRSEILDDHRIYHGNYLGNYYVIMMFPNVFSYELFEMYLPKSAWNQTDETAISTDHEDCFGRKKYASNTAGGYYASRLGVLEKLKELKKQSSILVLRFETPEYWASLGVWVVREASRKSLMNNALIFESKEEMLKKVKELVFRMLKFDITNILNNSVLLKKLKEQKMLVSYF